MLRPYGVGSRAQPLRNVTRLVVFALVPLAFLAYCAACPPDQSLLQTDSASYLAFAPERTGGYPFFLAALKPFASDLGAYVDAQLIVAALAVIAIGWSLDRLTGGFVLAMAAQVLLLANPEVNKQHFTIMTESLFFSVSIVMLAGAICYLRKPSVASLAIASIAAAYAAVVRPTGLAFLPIAVVLIALQRRQTSQTLLHGLVAVLAIVSVCGLETVYYRSQHDGPRRSLLPVHGFAKAGMLGVPDPDALLAGQPEQVRVLYRALETDLEPMRQFIRGAPNLAARCRLAANYESYLQYQFAVGERSALLSTAGEGPLTTIGLKRIAHAPADYLRHVAENLYCLWTVWAATNAEKDALSDYIARHQPIPFGDKVFASLATAPSSPLVYAVPPIMLTIAGMLLAAAIVVLWGAIGARPPRPWLTIAGIGGLMVHGSLLLTALTGIATPRYTLALWAPLSIGALAFGVYAVTEVMSVQRRKSSSLPRWS